MRCVKAGCNQRVECVGGVSAFIKQVSLLKGEVGLQAFRATCLVGATAGFLGLGRGLDLGVSPGPCRGFSSCTCPHTSQERTEARTALWPYRDVKHVKAHRCRAAELSRADRVLLCMHLAGHASQSWQRYTKLRSLAGRALLCQRHSPPAWLSDDPPAEAAQDSSIPPLLPSPPVMHVQPQLLPGCLLRHQRRCAMISQPGGCCERLPAAWHHHDSAGSGDCSVTGPLTMD